MSEHIPGVQHDPVLHRLLVDGVHIPNDVLAALGRLQAGDKVTIEKVDRNTLRIEGEAPPPLSKRSAVKDTTEHKTKRLQRVWPPEGAEIPLPESLKLNGKNPDEPIDEEK